MALGILDTTGTRGFGRLPLSNIVPFSYRDGATFADILYGLRDYMTETIHPDLTKNLNAVIEQLNIELREMSAEIVSGQDQMQSVYDVFLAEIERRVMLINNRVGPESIKRVRLTADYTLNVDPTWPNAHAIMFQFTQDAIGGRNIILGSNIVGPLEVDTTPSSVTEFYLVPNGAGKWTVSQSVILSKLDARITSMLAPTITGIRTEVAGQLAESATQMEALAGDVDAVTASQSDNGWLAATFLANGVGGEKLSLFYSPDGKTLFGGGDNPAYTPADNQGVRDPSLLRKNNRWYVVHTSNNGADKDIAIASSDNGNPGSWSLLTRISGASISTMTRMWAPEFIVDGNDTYIFFSSVTAGDKGSMYWVRATNTALTTWTAPVAVNFASSPTHYIDGVPVKNKDGKWYLFYSTGASIERAVSNTLTGQWTVDRTGNWAGWGNGLEGPTIVRDGDIFRAYFDRFIEGTGIHWSETSDLNGSWSSPVKVVTTPYAIKPGESIRHGSFAKLDTPAARNEIMAAMSMPRTGGTHKEFVAEGVTVTSKTAKFIDAVITDTNETVNDGLVTWNNSTDVFTLNKNCVYAISVMAKIEGVTGVDRSFIELDGADNVTIHMRQSGGAEDYFGFSMANFKPRGAGEQIKLKVFASWAGGQASGKVVARIRFTEIAPV